jgi:hypothetical protein
MAREKFHLRASRPVVDWLPGRVTQADERMVAVTFDAPVFANNGWPIADRTLWCTHGSRNLRRIVEEGNSHDQ